MAHSILTNDGTSLGVLNSLKRVQALDYIVVLFCMVLIPSAVAQSLMGLDERATFAILTPIMLVASVFSNRLLVHKTIPLLVVILMLLGSIASYIAFSLSQFLMGFTLGIAVIVGHQLSVTLGKPRVLRAVTWFALALLIGGVVGIAYSASGGQPLFEVRVGYRTTYLYLTTFSFANIGGIIRPSGIFDEPGSLAMFVAIVTMFNDTLRQNQKLTNVMVVLLVFTGALAGLVLAILYIVSSKAMKSKRKKSVVYISALLIAYLILSVATPQNIVTTTFETFYSDRLQVVDGRLVGDNRSNQVSEFFTIVDDEILLRGTKNSTQTDVSEDQSSNPFSITYGYGLLISLPYFGLLLWLAVITVRNRFNNSYTSLGLILLLLQRPYIYHMSWSILIAATVWLVYRASRDLRSRSFKQQ